ncbi:hypothetical protein Gotur_030463, partial [Gossypium turneri]
MTSRRRNGWQSFRICKKKISSGELRGCFQMRSYIGVGISTGSRQFLLATQGLAECKFLYKDDGYKRKAPEMANAW